MKKLLLIAVLLGTIVPCTAQDKPMRLEESLSPVTIYKKTTTFECEGYTYQCDVQENCQYVTLYNKENTLTYEDIVYKATGKIFDCSWSEDEVIESDYLMGEKA